MAININDRYRSFNYGSIKCPKLKGRVHVVLKDIKTGRIDKEFKGENVVTDAVADIMGNPYLGSLNTAALMPLYQSWYGGILGYKEAHTDDTDSTDYFIKGNDVQELTGHAGPTNPSAAQLAEDYKRGRKISDSFSPDGKTYTQVFEWGSQEGNGVYSALSLCHANVGDAGTGCASSTFQGLHPYASVGNLDNITCGLTAVDSNISTQYDDNHCLFFHIGEDSDYYVDHTSFATKKLTIKIRRLPYMKTGLIDTRNVGTAGEVVKIVELSNITFYLNPSFYFDYTNKRLWVFTNLTKVTPSYGDTSFGYRHDTMEYAIIDCESGTVLEEHYYGGTGDNAPITATESDLAPSCMQTWQNSSYSGTVSIFNNMNYVVRDGFIFLPTTSGIYEGNRSNLCAYNINGFRKIKLADQAVQALIPFNNTIQQANPASDAGGLIIFGGRVMNGDTVYTCVQQFSQMAFGTNYGGYVFSQPNKILTLATPLGCGRSTSEMPRYLFANKLVNTTIFNLKDSQQQPTNFVKTASKLLQVTYSLTEVTT